MTNSGGILSVALSLSTALGPQTVGVTHHPVLWSPDFPLPGSHRSTIQAAIVQPACRHGHYIIDATTLVAVRRIPMMPSGRMRR